MKRIIFSALTGMAAIAVAPAAQAATFPVGSANFTATQGPNGTVSGAFYNTGIAAGTFTDTFTFTLPFNGVGSGTVTTSTNFVGAPNDLDFTSVLINDTAATITRLGNGAFEFAFANMVPIVAGRLNTITVTGLSRGNGAYGGQASFIPSAVPEPATWALMLVGFAMVGATARFRRRSTKVVFA
ncbi:FxDxF family PEP-CTERM protein [Sphingomonas abaci]|uniref:Ice-binding protein C-terminal domain-containing protein n=1 Tax=Sphingomonas abaci TaxID=237611 RepID=A0A7W7AL28_9SPHN|nr:FxDxF family PEP-CTERM protein [Sphingomonas abaci]MBB4618821.1 hypothetical protein [Sphingomonas abaci]